MMNKTINDYKEGKWSFSFLKNFAVSPRMAMAYMQEERKETLALLQGKVFHAVLAEQFAKEFAILDEADRPEPDKTMASKANKLWKSEQQQNAFEAGLTIVTQEMYELSNIMRNAVKTHPIGSKLLSWAGEVEKQFDRGRYTGRVDAVYHEQKIIVDYKSTAKLNPEWFDKDIYKYHYHAQAATYRHIVGDDYAVMLVFVEKAPPYDVVPVLIAPESEPMRDGWSLIKSWTYMAEQAFENNEWPGISSRFAGDLLEL